MEKYLIIIIIIIIIIIMIFGFTVTKFCVDKIYSYLLFVGRLVLGGNETCNEHHVWG